MQTIFQNKTVIITGHTGFKGSWLSVWLNMLGANVHGISNEIPTSPSHYELHKDVFFNDSRLDVRNFNDVKNFLKEVKPDFIFHLAAQPIVIK